jgi:hypothetical protein
MMRVCFADVDTSQKRTRDLASMTVAQLKAWLKDRGVHGISKMNRADLVAAATQNENTALTAKALCSSSSSALDVSQHATNEYNALRMWYAAHVSNEKSTIDAIDKVAFHLVRTAEALLEAERSTPTTSGWRAAPLTRLPATQRVRRNFEGYMRAKPRQKDKALYHVLPQVIANLWKWPSCFLNTTMHSAKLLELVTSVVIATSRKRKRDTKGEDELSILDELAELYPKLRDCETQKVLQQGAPSLFPPLRNIIWEYWHPWGLHPL